MKATKLKIILLLIMSLTFVGCESKYLADDEGKTITTEASGRTLRTDILCLPKEEEVINIYNEVDAKLYSGLPACKDLKITTGGYEGLWMSFLVKPLAFLIILIGTYVGNYGLALIITSIIIRLCLYPLTKKTAEQSEKMSKAKPDLEKLEKKYKDKKSKEEAVNKNQEMMTIYKKHHINPVGGCLFSMIQLPLFIAFLSSINRVPAIFEETFLGFNLGVTPKMAIFTNGDWYYIIIVILIVVTSFFSFKFTSQDNGSDQAKQMKSMMKFMIIFIGFASFTLSTAIGVYWITSSLFTIGQNLIVKRRSANENI